MKILLETRILISLYFSYSLYQFINYVDAALN